MYRSDLDKFTMLKAIEEIRHEIETDNKVMALEYLKLLWEYIKKG